MNVDQQRSRVCIVGGGPAGVMAGLLLARRGVTVTVVEKHADFHRDFRGDTVHPSTQELIAELGWLDEFLALPHNSEQRIQVEFGGRQVTVADFSRLPVRNPALVFVPQWDLLNFLATKAEKLAEFTMLRSAEVTGLLTENGTVTGVVARHDGEIVHIGADLVIGADGRHSVTRRESGLPKVESPTPIDVFWLRIPRYAGERLPFFTGGRGSLISIDRGEYWQLAYAFPRGAGTTLRSAGLDALREHLVGLRPEYAERLGEIRSWDDVHELAVRVDRLTRWHRPGLLCIGDAAHAMSPAGGVGINLAVQDAVATANILGPILVDRPPTPQELDRVRRRRALPARLTQFVQSRMLNGFYAGTSGPEAKMPAALTVLSVLPFLRHITGRLIGLGARPEHIAQERS